MNVQSQPNCRPDVTMAGIRLHINDRKMGSIEGGAGGKPVTISHRRL
jgi:hypothetical protein